MTTNRKTDPKFVRAYERGMLRSAFVSLFWGVIAERKKREGYTLQALAQSLGTNKAEVSRWFNGNPNWTLNTVASIANALNLDLRIEAVERSTGRIFTPSGVHPSTTLESMQKGAEIATTEENLTSQILKSPYRSNEKQATTEQPTEFAKAA